MMTVCSVLVVDDDRVNRELIAQILEDDAFKVHQAVDIDRALTLVDTVRPDIIILDMVLPGTSGRVGARRIKARYPATSILAISAARTALPSRDDDDYAAILAKPFDVEDLLTIVRSLCVAGLSRASASEPFDVHF